MSVITLVRAYTHGGLGTPTASQHNIFESENFSQIFLVPLTQAGFEPPVFGSRVTLSPPYIQSSLAIGVVFLLSVEGLELDNLSGVIPARSKLELIATVRPVRRITYQYTVSYQLIMPESKLTV